MVGRASSQTDGEIGQIKGEHLKKHPQIDRSSVSGDR